MGITGETHDLIVSGNCLQEAIEVSVKHFILTVSKSAAVCSTHWSQAGSEPEGKAIYRLEIDKDNESLLFDLLSSTLDSKGNIEISFALKGNSLCEGVKGKVRGRKEKQSNYEFRIEPY